MKTFTSSFEHCKYGNKEALKIKKINEKKIR